MKRKNEDIEKKHHHLEEAIQLIFRGLIPLALLAGGLVLLDLRIFAWSLIFGLPTTVVGVALLIFTYDDVMGKKIGKIPPRFADPEVVNCFNCGNETPLVSGEWEEDILCPTCKQLKKEGKEDLFSKRRNKKK